MQKKIVQKSPELPDGLAPTWIARFLFNSMRRIHDRRGIAIFSGPPGIGKTTAIEAFARSTHCILHITVTPRTRSTALIQHIKEALRPHIVIPSGSSWSGTYSLQQNLARDMRQFAGSHRIDSGGGLGQRRCRLVGRGRRKQIFLSPIDRCH